jgi:hypothetical protein
VNGVGSFWVYLPSEKPFLPQDIYIQEHSVTTVWNISTGREQTTLNERDLPQIYRNVGKDTWEIDTSSTEALQTGTRRFVLEVGIDEPYAFCRPVSFDKNSGRCALGGPNMNIETDNVTNKPHSVDIHNLAELSGCWLNLPDEGSSGFVIALAPGGKYLARNSKNNHIQILDVDESSPTFGECLQVLEVKMNCQGMRITGATGLDAPTPDGEGTLRDWLLARGAVDEHPPEDEPGNSSQ